MATIKMSAKCSDLFCASLVEKGKPDKHYEGSVPYFFPGPHYGDYVQFHIDVDTGRILNWKKPDAAALKLFR